MQANKHICIVSPFAPPLGGMAIQAEKIVGHLKKNGYPIISVRTNSIFPSPLSSFNKIPGLRTGINSILFLYSLQKALKNVETVYFLSGFFNFFIWVTFPAILLVKAKKKKMILNARGGGAREFFQKYRLFLKPIINSVDVITTPSGFLQKAFLDFFNVFPIIVPNIADLEQFKFRERPVFQPRILVTRSLEKMYNVACVIRAFSKINNVFPESRLGIVGDGSERKNLEKLASELGLKDKVQFFGRVAHCEIQNYYSNFDFFINASNVDNFPGTILEAFASGLPVISTNAGGIPYMVEDGVTGLLADKDDSDGLADRVIHLMGNQEKARMLVNNARKECEKYSWDHIKEILIPVLDEKDHGKG